MHNTQRINFSCMNLFETFSQLHQQSTPLLLGNIPVPRVSYSPSPHSKEPFQQWQNRSAGIIYSCS
jgi:hypothetical protein